MKSLGIIADDLTGSLDTGVQFSKRGVTSLVGLQDGALPDATCVIVNTDSRSMRPDAAAKAVKDAAALLRGRVVYKKIDSTLRGNLGSELLAALRALGATKGVVAPAFPANGRTVLGGRLLVNGLPLERMGFSSDPLNAIAESHIPTLLQEQTREPVGLIGLEIVERGASAIYEAIAHRPERIIVVDAESGKHLADLALAIARSDEAWLPVGSAGLAEALSSALDLRSAEGDAQLALAVCGPVLVVAGSRNEVTAAQVRELGTVMSIPPLAPDVRRWLSDADGDGEAERIAVTAGRRLESGKGAIITTCFTPLLAGGSRDIAVALGRLTRTIMSIYPVGALFLTGGDVALRVCLALGGVALHPVEEVLPGLPVSLLRGGRWDGLPVVTKAGGFGQRNALVVGYHYLTNGSKHDQQ